MSGGGVHRAQLREVSRGFPADPRHLQPPYSARRAAVTRRGLSECDEELTGIPTATETAETIRREIRGETELTASAGVAPNKFLAKIASDWKKPDGLFVIQPEEVDSFLLPLSVGRLPGVGKVTEEKLKKLDTQTVRDLRRLDLPALEDHFGRY